MNALQYQVLTENGLDKKVIQVLEEAFQSKDEATATKGDVEITKLALQKEIEEVKLTLQKEIEKVKLTLQKEIEEVKLTLQKEIKEVKLTLQKEIKEVELRLTKEIQEVRKEIHHSNLKMLWVMIGLLSPMYVGILSIALKVFFFQ